MIALSYPRQFLRRKSRWDYPQFTMISYISPNYIFILIWSNWKNIAMNVDGQHRRTPIVPDRSGRRDSPAQPAGGRWSPESSKSQAYSKKGALSVYIHTLWVGMETSCMHQHPQFFTDTALRAQLAQWSETLEWILEHNTRSYFFISFVSHNKIPTSCWFSSSWYSYMNKTCTVVLLGKS